MLDACPEELLPTTQQPTLGPQTAEGGETGSALLEAWTLELPADASDAELVRLLAWFSKACGCSEGGQGDER